MRPLKNSLFAAQKYFFDHSNVRFTARLQHCNTAAPQFAQNSFSRFFRNLFITVSTLPYPIQHELKTESSFHPPSSLMGFDRKRRGMWVFWDRAQTGKNPKKCLSTRFDVVSVMTRTD